MKFFQRSLLSALVVSALFTSVPTILTTQAQPSPDSRAFSITRIGLAGIKLGDKGTQVQRILGKPQQTRIEQTNCCGTLHHWKYANLEVSFDDIESTKDPKKFSAYQIITKSSKFVTLDGIRVGDRRNKVLQVYGNSGLTSDRHTLFYSNDQYGSALVFRLKHDRVIEIVASTQLN